MYVCRPLKHVLCVQGYGVELPVHRPPHVPTGRASTGLGSDQVSVSASHLNPAVQSLCEVYGGLAMHHKTAKRALGLVASQGSLCLVHQSIAMTGPPGTGFPDLLLAPMSVFLCCGAGPGLHTIHTMFEQPGLVTWSHTIVLWCMARLAYISHKV